MAITTSLLASRSWLFGASVSLPSSLPQHVHHLGLKHRVDSFNADACAALGHSKHVHDFDCEIVDELAQHETHHFHRHACAAVPEHFQQGQGRNVDGFRVIDQTGVILEYPPLATRSSFFALNHISAAQLAQSMGDEGASSSVTTDRSKLTVPGVTPPKPMPPPPNRFLKRSMLRVIGIDDKDGEKWKEIEMQGLSWWYSKRCVCSKLGVWRLGSAGLDLVACLLIVSIDDDKLTQWFGSLLQGSPAE